MFYEVGKQNIDPGFKFTNRFQAAHYAGTNKLNMHFNMYEDAFDKCDWTKEPNASWDHLLDIRAQQIAAKKKPIVLNFSGGTDSYTIYKVFERNKIPIDVIYTRPRTDVDKSLAWEKVFSFLNNEIYDKSTKIIIRDNLSEIHNNGYSHPDWIWDYGGRCQFSVMSMGDAESNMYVAKILGTDNFTSIIGLEKPRLFIDPTGIYSYQDDENYASRVMSNNAIDCFYISPDLPELHIKQSYLLLKYLKSLCGENPRLIDLMKFNTAHNPLKFDWINYSILGCGRYGDLNMSHLQHQGMASVQLVIPDTKFTGDALRGRGGQLFKSFESTNMFKNYTDGIMSVINDTAGKFLQIEKDNFYRMRHFYSKFYKMSF